MKAVYLFVFVALITCACVSKPAETFQSKLIGTWQLVDALQIKKDSTIHTTVPGRKMIKIINDTHFAFLNHNVREKGDTTTTHFFGGGGGSYDLVDTRYTEHLEFCTARGYEGNDFTFDLEIRGDTLIQKGVEALKDFGIGEENLQIVEVYVRVTPPAKQ
ncbi:hypothetical protein [Pseudochryseolinea flava]|uniref:Lipocalin-like domain-containing protein n=1 Tax=Pseudochryseolinea flava TaxID=2059302 RepID=A0A364Y6G8_9BACT|nr:hypothetical protein [Pseudochryseolinea flava]RAW01407.1 hypothetical protein DQQ10_10925 [Pseudochryseolinea flava]